MGASPATPNVRTAAQAADQPRASGSGRSIYLTTLPFRDEIGDTAFEMDIARWSSLGGEGAPFERRKRLLERLASAQTDNRQKARWDYARFLVSTDRALEGAAVLDAMAEDEPLLEEVAAFQGVRAIARITSRRYAEGITALSVPALTDSAEACLWRSYAHALSGNPQAALLSWPCAIPAANRETPESRLRFALPIVEAAHAVGRHDLANDTLKKLSRSNLRANYWRGVYAFQRGENDLGRKLLTKVRDAGFSLLSSRAELAMVNAEHAAGVIKTQEAIQRLDKMRFTWRGGPFEASLLRSLSHLEESHGNLRGALAASAPLIRYMDIGRLTSAEIHRAQQMIARSLDPASKLSLADQAGIYWDYRDLAPQGLDGDEIIRRLASKMAAEGLHKRAADLLERQIEARLDDAAPAVAVRAAQLRLLAGQPDKALKVLEATNEGAIAADIRQQRQVLYLYSLLSLGRGGEAMAILDGNAEQLSSDMRAELYWQGKEWAKYMALNGPLIAARGAALNNEVRAMIVRQAIAASIGGYEAELGRLRTLYSSHFDGQDSYLGPAFRLLTGASRIDEEALTKAMVDVEKAAPANVVLGWVTALSDSKPSQKAG
jgi:hypothetical protein